MGRAGTTWNATQSHLRYTASVLLKKIQNPDCTPHTAMKPIGPSLSGFMAVREEYKTICFLLKQMES